MTALYRWFLRILPRSLRDQFGEEMVELFAAQLGDLPSSRWVRLRFLLRSLLDAVTQGVAERRCARRLARSVRPGVIRRCQRIVAMLLTHVRIGWRQLYRTPVATGAIVITLAMALGATTSIYSVVHSVLFRALPYDRPEALVGITSVRPDRPDAPFTLPEFMDYRERSRTVELVAYANWSANLSLPHATRRLQGTRISANGFAVLGMRAVVGRLLEPSDDDAASPRVAVLGYGLWQREFAGRSDVVGQSIRLNSQPYTVVGVMPRHFPLVIRDIEVAVPLSPDLDPWRHARSSTNFLIFLGRLKASVTAESAEKELSAIARVLRSQFPVDYASKLSVRVTPMHEVLVGGTRASLLVLLAGVLLMLCIALANLMSLLLIRATTRKHELAVRRAIGASRAQLVMQLLAEGGLLAGIGSALGVGLAFWAVAVVVRGAPIGLPRLEEVTLDGQVLLFTGIVTVTATLLLSIAPLAVALRTHPQESLGAGIRGRIGGWEQHTRHAFVVAEIALALVLLSATVLLANSVWRLQRVDPGFDAENVFVARVSLPRQAYSSVTAMVNYYDRLHESLRALPGVQVVGVINVAPLSGLVASIPFSVAGRSVARAEWPSARFRVISAGYLAAAGTRLTGGRAFTEFDTDQTPRVALISQALADANFPGVNPVGQQLLIDDNNEGPRPVEIVGVIQNVSQTALDAPQSVDIYIPWKQVHPNGVVWLANNHFWALRVSGEPLAMGPAFLRELRAVDPDAATDGTGALRDFLDAWLAPRRFNAALLFGFTLVALILAVTGVYAVMAYNVTLRRREIGLRMALGATRSEITQWLMLQVLRLSLLGIGLGLAVAVAGSGAISELLFGVTPRDPTLLAAVAATILTLSALAGCIVAVQTAHEDPGAALIADI